MSKQKKYLLEKTSEAEEQTKNIIQFLQTGDVTNIKLALQFLKAGGVPDKVWTYLLGLLWCQVVRGGDKRVVNNLLKKQAPEGFYETLDNIYRSGLKANKRNFTKLFEDKQYPFPKMIDKTALANQILRLNFSNRTIVKYCLKHQTMSNQDILKCFLSDNKLELSLGNLQLDNLPSEIGYFNNIKTLNISQNNFTDIPDELQELKYLEEIYYYHTPLSEESIQKLKNFFPKIFAKELYSEANRFFNRNEYQNALEKISESLSLYDNDSDAWNTKGVSLQRLKRKEEALLCFEKSIELDPQNTLAWSNMALTLHRQKKYEDSLQAASSGLDIFRVHSQVNRYWESTLYFRKGHALSYLGRLEESESAYQQAIKIKPKYGPALYNLACLYAEWGQKNKVLDFLQQAINCDQKFIKEAREDTDFEQYWEDEDFKTLLLFMS